MYRLNIIICLLITQHVFSQTMLRPQHITVNEGLSQNSVNYILQDAHGFIWLATGDGLNRYDGKEFIAYKSRSADTLANQMKDRNINSAIFEDEQGRFWMTTDAGLSYLNARNGRYRLIMANNENRNAAHILAIDNRQVWCAVLRTDIVTINLNTLEKKRFPFTDSLQMLSPRVYPITNGVISEGNLWMADAAGLFAFDTTTHTDNRAFRNNITAAYPLADSRLLLTAAGGVYFYNITERTGTFLPIKQGAKSITWKSFAQDTTTGTVYLGANNDGTICRLNPANGTFNFIHFQNNPVNCLFIDRSRNLWAGTEGNGAFKMDIKPQKFFRYTPEGPGHGQSESALMVKSIYRAGNGPVWIGTYNNGLILYDLLTGQQKQPALPVSPGSLLISTIFRDSSGMIVVTADENIFWFDPVSITIKRHVRLPLKPEFAPEDPVIFSLVEWKKGHYLAGTNISLFTINTENHKPVIERPRVAGTNGYLSSYTYNLYRQTDGNIDVGKRSGYAKIKMMSDTSLQLLDKGFDQTVIRHFYKSSTTPVLWIASEKGLLAYNETTKQYTAFDERNGLANSCVYGILPQNDSMLWISTNKGISFVKAHYGDAVSATFTNYSAKDGLQSNEFNTGAYYIDGNGTYYFGGVAGMNWFNPSQVRSNPYKATPVITEIFVNDLAYARDTANYITALELPYKKNTISFTLRALEFTGQEQNRFAYKLAGQDNDWVITTNDKVRYSALRPGNYTFLLKVSNNDGLWNDTPLALKITITPPFWETWWFRSLTLAMALGITLLSIRLYVKQKVRARTIELEKQQMLYDERLRISKDVHDDLGAGLSKISLMAELAKQKTAHAGLEGDIQHISATSKELVDNMRDLIWVLNPENTTLEQLTARLREYCADYLEQMPLQVTLDFPAVVPVMRIAREAQRNIFLTAKEAINNCVKHAGATKLNVTLAIEHEHLHLIMHDDGHGFDVNAPGNRGNGLRNMRQRIEAIGGTFTITSAPGNTTVALIMPLAKLCAQENTTFM